MTNLLETTGQEKRILIAKYTGGIGKLLTKVIQQTCLFIKKSLEPLLL